MACALWQRTSSRLVYVSQSLATDDADEGLA
jgi:hypothetical protein